MKIKYFRAQSLDNISADFVCADNYINLAGHDRQEAVDLISEINDKALKVYESDNVKLMVASSLGLVHVLPNESDESGRSAPIICCIDIISGEDNPELIGRKIVSFANAIDRTISKPVEASMVVALVTAKKKPLRISSKKAVLWTMAAILILLMIGSIL